MCRDLQHPNARRCPSSMGEARNARDRLRYATKNASAITSPVDVDVTDGLDVQPTQAPLEDIAADVRTQIHTAFHNHTGLNLGHSAADDDDLVGRTNDWRELEQRVREVGAQIESRAEEIAGIGSEEIEKAHLAAVARINEEIKPLNDLAGGAENEWYRARRKLEAARLDHPTKDHSELQEEVDGLHDAWTAAIEASQDAARNLARDFGYDEESLEGYPGIKKALREIGQGTDPDTQGRLKALAEARVRALQEVRDMGGAAIETHEKSSKRVMKVMDEVAQVYPTDWIRMSNATGNLKVKDTKGRAHYTAARSQKVRKVLSEKTWTVGDDTPDGDGWVRGVWTGSGWVNPLDNPDAAEKYAGEVVYDDEPVYWYRPAFKTRRRYDGKDVEGPPPRGWKEAFETQSDGTKVRVFRQPEYYMSHGETTAELTVDRDKASSQWQDTPGLGTAIHEFAHRCEHVNPVIGKLEEAFLERRTTNADGDREPLQNIYGSSREKARLDSFADKYMGKEYSAASMMVSAGGQKKSVTVVHREVMSTGMESLFAGAFGSLSGIDGKTSDADMRSFILGVLATS